MLEWLRRAFDLDDWSWRWDQVEPDLDAAPFRLHLRANLNAVAAFWVLFAVACFLVIMLLPALVAPWRLTQFVPALALSAGLAMAVWKGWDYWLGDRDVTIDDGTVAVETRRPLQTTSWTEPLAAYAGVALRRRIATRTDKRHEAGHMFHWRRDPSMLTVVWVIELVHQNPARTLPLMVRDGGERPNDMLEALAGRLGLRILTPPPAVPPEVEARPWYGPSRYAAEEPLAEALRGWPSPLAVERWFDPPDGITLHRRTRRTGPALDVELTRPRRLRLVWQVPVTTVAVGVIAIPFGGLETALAFLIAAAFLAVVLRGALHGTTGAILSLGSDGVRDLRGDEKGGIPLPWSDIRTVRTVSAQSRGDILLEIATIDAAITIRGAPFDRARFNWIRDFVVSVLLGEAESARGDPRLR